MSGIVATDFWGLPVFKKNAYKFFGIEEQRDPENTLRVVVSRKRFLADKVVELEFRDPDGKDLPAFTAGAHIDVHIKPGMMRQYSLPNNPAETDRYISAVLMEPEGKGGSIALYNDVQEGDHLLVSLPRNHFPLVEEAPYSIFVAGGIGLTPLMAMAYRLRDLGKPFKFYYRARARAWAAYPDLLTEEFGDSVECLFSDEGGREKFDLEKILQEAPEGTHIYTCGANSFMEFVTSTAEKYLPEDNIHLEYFYAAFDGDAADNKAFEIYCTKSDVTLTVPPEKSITDVLDENGIDIPVSCADGICGSCITKFVEGEVEHRDGVLSKSDREKKQLFTPCCSRAVGERIAIEV